AVVPMASTWTSPRRTMAATRPGGAPCSTWPARTSWTRSRRSLERPLPRVMPDLTPPGRRTHRSAARDLAPGGVRGEAGLTAQAEDPVADDVALDVVAAAGDRRRRRGDEGDDGIGLGRWLAPGLGVPGAQHPAGALHVDHELGDVLAEAALEQLEHRALRP